MSSRFPYLVRFMPVLSDKPLTRWYVPFSVAVAETTLYIPGFDPQAITANNIGTDASGHTTWVIGSGVTSGTYEDAPGIVHSGASFLCLFCLR